MESSEIVRAWRDREFRESLPQETQDALPEAPANASSMSDAELEQAAGAFTPGAALAVGVASLGVSAANTVRHWND